MVFCFLQREMNKECRKVSIHVDSWINRKNLWIEGANFKIGHQKLWIEAAIFRIHQHPDISYHQVHSFPLYP